MYRIARSFQIGLHEFHEGEIITPLDFFGKLHGLDLAPVADYIEPIEFYFFRRCSPVLTRVDSLSEEDFSHTGPGPIKELNAAMLALLAANKLNNVSGFDTALEKVEMILRQVEGAKPSKHKKEAARVRRIKKTIADEKVKDTLKKAMSGRLKK